MMHAVIMAGGSGTRFWPASRQAKPKQLLDLSGSRTMIQATVDRLNGLVNDESILILTNKRLVGQISEQLPQLPSDSIVGEPCKRDTAPCVGLAAALVHAKDPDGIMVVMPADHIITPNEEFQEAILQARDLVQNDPSTIVTFGIKPTYPAEGFGYVERGDSIGAGAYQVQRFREKPTADVAQEYLDAGTFYWNSGIFVWRAQTILDALREFAPEIASHIDAIRETIGTDRYPDTLAREFEAINGTSIDFAVMERYSNVAVIEAPFAWDDVGNWQSLSRTVGMDEDGNTIIGKHLGVRTTGSIIRTTENHLVATVGLKDCIVVHTDDATLVANKHDEEAVRQIVQLLEEQSMSEHL